MEVEEGAEVELVVDGDEEDGNDVIDEGGIVAPVQVWRRKSKKMTSFTNVEDMGIGKEGCTGRP